MSTTADRMTAIAKGEVGYHEGRSGGHWNNREKYAAQVPGLAWVSDGGYPWCAVFIAWVAMKAGVADLFPRTASTDFGAGWFKERGQWSEYPAVPAQVFFGTNGDMYHTGLVIDFDADSITTVEGNTNTSGSAEGDGVYIKRHLRRDVHVQGYGYPKGIVVRSADPHRPADATPPKAPAPSAGRKVEAAIDDLSAAKGKGKRRTVLDRVLRALKGLRR